MKFRILLATILILITANSYAQEAVPKSYDYIVKIGQQAPNFKTQTVDGKPFELSALKGKIVMLQFTASWCGVCRKEMPHIEKEIWDQYKNNPDFRLFAVDYAEPVSKAAAFAKEVPITYPVLMDPKGDYFHLYAGPKAGVTRNVIIDKTGKIVFMTRLYKPEEFNKMKTVIANLLKN